MVSVNIGVTQKVSKWPAGVIKGIKPRSRKKSRSRRKLG